LLCK
jgi:hypothetical protein